MNILLLHPAQRWSKLLLVLAIEFNLICIYLHLQTYKFLVQPWCDAYWSKRNSPNQWHHYSFRDMHMGLISANPINASVYIAFPVFPNWLFPHLSFHSMKECVILVSYPNLVQKIFLQYEHSPKDSNRFFIVFLRINSLPMNRDQIWVLKPFVLQGYL